jgi:hypothetical protein
MDDFRYRSAFIGCIETTMAQKTGFDMAFQTYASANSAHRSTGVFAYLTELSGS